MFDKLVPRSVYLRLFLLLSFIVTLTVLIFSYVLTRMFSQYAWEEIDEFARHRIEQIDRNTEFTLKKLMLYGLRMYEDRALKNWMTANEDNALLQHEAMTILTDYLAVEPYIHSVYLVNMNTRRVFSSLEGVSDFEDFEDRELMRAITEGSHPVLKFENDPANHASLLLLSIPAAPSNQGRLAMMIDKTKLRDFLLPPDDEKHSKIFILDESGRIILGDADEAVAGDISAQAGRREEAGLFRWEGEGRSWTVRHTALNMGGWRIYHMLPANILKDRAETFTRTLLAATAAMLVVLVAAIFWGSRKNFKPFSELTALLQQKLGLQGNDKIAKLPEFRVIESGVLQLLDKMDQLHISLKNSQQMVLEEHLRQWLLSGRLHDGASQMIRQHTRLLDGRPLQLAIIRIEKYLSFAEQYDFASRKLLKYAMENICREVLESADWHGECVDLGSDHLALLIVPPPSGDPVGVLEEVKLQILRWLQIPTTIAVSNPVEPRENLSPLYKKVLELSTLRFINGVDKIYTVDDLETGRNAEPAQWDQHVKQLIQAVRLRNKAAMESCLQAISGQLHGLSYPECKLQLTHLVYQLMRTFKRLSELQGMNGIQHDLERFSSLQEIMRWLRNELNEIIRDLGKKHKSNRKEELYREMVEYVQRQIFDPMLTVEELAEHVSVSSDYARKIFKDFNDLSLSEYIIFERVRHAKRMLLETALPAMEVAERCGFQSKSHFYTAFKKLTGLTPNQYRQHREEPE
jgi:AraC-like DNA-binding protein